MKAASDSTRATRATKAKNPVPGSKTATASESGDGGRLRACIYSIDSIAHEGFSQIAAIARLAQAALKGADDGPWVADISHALQVIRGKAYDTGSCINSEAEEVGCAFYDPEFLRRYAIHEAKFQEGGAA